MNAPKRKRGAQKRSKKQHERNIEQKAKAKKERKKERIGRKHSNQIYSKARKSLELCLETNCFCSYSPSIRSVCSIPF